MEQTAGMPSPKASPAKRKRRYAGYRSESDSDPTASRVVGSSTEQKKGGGSTEKRKRRHARHSGYKSDSDSPTPSRGIIIPATEERISRSRSEKGKQVKVTNTQVRVPLKALLLESDKASDVLKKKGSGEGTRDYYVSEAVDFEEQEILADTTQTEDSDSEYDYEDDDYEENGGTHTLLSRDRVSPAKSKANESKEQKVGGKQSAKTNLMKEWVPYREAYLDELMAREYPFTNITECNCCAKALSANREAMKDVGLERKVKRSDIFKDRAALCEECNIGPMCVDCAVKSHAHAPLHILKTFNGCYWEKTTLHNLGYILQLGHADGLCGHPTAGKVVTVLDTRGIQHVNVRFCDCALNIGASQEHRDQLLRYGWFPATVQRPETVATLSVLRLFEQMSFQGKISAHDFYQTLVNITDNSVLKAPKRRYKEFLRMARQYRHLMMLKRKGVALNEDKTRSIKSGDLAQSCPACPHPDINLPVDWKTREDRWIYCLYLMMDANFRLKSKAKGIDDIELGSGWSYFVEDNAYRAHVANHVNEDEMKYCTSGLRAVDHANLRGNQFYDATGVVGIQCRHMLMRKNGVGDLQRGERQINVDFILLSTLIAVNILQLVISYDISCQYSVNFKKRMEKYPVEMQLDLSMIFLLFVIPKFHLPGHGEKCQSKFSLNFREHMGRTDGENIERGWAHLNPLAMSTKEMGSGSRHDMLNEQIDIFNYMRILKFGDSFASKLIEASEEAGKHKEALKEFNESFTEKVISKLETKIANWEGDTDNNEDPFREPRITIKMSDVKRELALQEALECGKGHLKPNRLTATHWLTVGMELEDVQLSLKATYATMKETQTSLRKEATDDKSAMVYYKIKIWMEMQQLFMPGLVNLNLATASEKETEALDDEHIREVWKIKLVMPSSLNKDVRDKVCVEGLAEKERRLREAQAYDILEEARTALRKGYIYVNQKILHVAGTGQERNSRMNLAISDVNRTRDTIRERYKNAREALFALDPLGGWSRSLKELKEEHLVAKSRKEGGKSEGRRFTSWIWTMPGVGMNREQEQITEAAERKGNDSEDGDSEYERNDKSGRSEAEDSSCGSEDEEDEIDDSTDKGESENYDKALAIEWARAKARADRWSEEVILLKEEMRRTLDFFLHEAKYWIFRGRRYLEDKSNLSKAYIAYANKRADETRLIALSFQEKWNKTGVVLFDKDFEINMNDVQSKLSDL